MSDCTLALNMDSERDPAERGLFRLLYHDWHPTRLGHLVNRLTGWRASSGFAPTSLQTLEVPGRTSGAPRSTPVVVVTVADERYLVSMLGSGSEWVKNVAANDGAAVLQHGRREPIHLVEVPPDRRAPILREYVRVAESGRRHLPLDPDAPLSEFAAIADRYPVFHIRAG